jgi:hypothetical protein
MAVALDLEDEERRTAAHLRQQEELAARLRGDPRLAALLDQRRAGRSPDEAVQEIERRYPPRASDGTGGSGMAGPPRSR